MTMSKFARTTLVATLTTVIMSGAALASSPDISTTGPSSNNTVSIDTSNHVNVNNNNNVTVKNTNYQTANSGDANVYGNTTGGNAVTGEASNSNMVQTTVEIGSTAKGGGSGNGGGSGSESGNGGSSSGTGSSSTAKGGGSSSSVGGGTLPETGASQSVDVSALRNLLGSANPASPLVKANQTISKTFLLFAAILSLLAAVGTAVYSTKRTLRV